jgi:hypothetical protein
MTNAFEKVEALQRKARALVNVDVWTLRAHVLRYVDVPSKALQLQTNLKVCNKTEV